MTRWKASLCVATVGLLLTYGCAGTGRSRSGDVAEVQRGTALDISRFIGDDGTVSPTPVRPEVPARDSTTAPRSSAEEIPNPAEIEKAQPTAGVDSQVLEELRQNQYDIVQMVAAPPASYAMPHVNVAQGIEYYPAGFRNPYGIVLVTDNEMSWPEMFVGFMAGTVAADVENLLVFYPEDNPGAKLPWKIELKKVNLRTNLEGITLPDGQEVFGLDERWIAIVPPRLSNEMRDGHSFPDIAFTPNNVLVTADSFSNHSMGHVTTPRGCDITFAASERLDGTYAVGPRHVEGRPRTGPDRPMRPIAQ